MIVDVLGIDNRSGLVTVGFRSSRDSEGNYTDLITFNNQNSLNYRIEKFKFADGTIVTGGVEGLMLKGTGSGNENFTWGNGAINYTGGNGNDIITSGAHNDILAGGKGNDTLYGGAGDDTYIYNIGDGHDTINDGHGNDTLIFGEGINLEDIHVVANVAERYTYNRHVTLGLKNSVDENGVYQDTVTLQYQQYNGNVSNRIENFKFADGTLITGGVEGIMHTGTAGNDNFYWTLNAINYNGGDGDDTITGGTGSNNDILAGGKGNDTMNGGGGDDTYIYNIGDGHDTINDGHGNDTLIFGEGISLDDIHVVANVRGDKTAIRHITLGLKSSIDENGVYQDTITMYNQQCVNSSNHADARYRIENFKFADGTVITGGIEGLMHTGTSGNDDFQWSHYAINYNGGDGDDTITGGTGSNNDILAGGKGNDTMNGGGGDDTYIYNIGDGHDTINDGHGNDTLIFGEGISLDDIHVVANVRGDKTAIRHITLGLKSSIDENGVYQDTITMYNQQCVNSSNHADARYRIENFKFADGTVITGGIEGLMHTGTSGNDDFQWSHYAINYNGGDGDDTITGGTGSNNDILAGGKGNDTMNGGGGDDTYIYNIGDGHDTINDGHGNDTLIFGEGISLDDIHVVANVGGDKTAIRHITLGLKSSIDENGKYQDTITMYNQQCVNSSNHADARYRIENFKFADGTVITGGIEGLMHTGTSGNDDFQWSHYAINYNGGDGDDTITGGTGSNNDILAGGKGNDTMNGGGGDDTYIYNIGDGHDTINDGHGNDTLIFGEGISLDDIHVVANVGGDKTAIRHITLGLKSSIDENGKYQDTITMYNQQCVNSLGHENASYRIENFKFADGTVITGGIEGLMHTGTSGNDDFQWSHYAINYNGGDGDDTIGTGVHNDILSGGKGNDTLQGGAGDDTYIFNIGDGHDTINDGGGDDTIVLEKVLR